jgi:hypothetical protein
VQSHIALRPSQLLCVFLLPAFGCRSAQTVPPTRDSASSETRPILAVWFRPHALPEHPRGDVLRLVAWRSGKVLFRANEKNALRCGYVDGAVLRACVDTLQQEGFLTERECDMRQQGGDHTYILLSHAQPAIEHHFFCADDNSRAMIAQGADNDPMSAHVLRCLLQFDRWIAATRVCIPSDGCRAVTDANAEKETLRQIRRIESTEVLSNEQTGAEVFPLLTSDPPDRPA